MVAQFLLNHYPTGSLISELLQIYAGKFVVRVTVAIEGVNRATGMAAAETIELAEDRARMRALAVLGIEQTTLTPKDLANFEVSTFTPTDPTMPAAADEPVATEPEDLHSYTTATVPPALPVDPVLNLYQDSIAEDDFAFPVTSSIPDVVPDLPSEKDLTPTTKTNSRSKQNTSNVTPFGPRGNQQLNSTNSLAQHDSATVIQKKEPVDLSNILARTDIELERLGWTKEQGRDYLIRTYNKRGRTLLTEEELLEFLQYLESQP